jgi:hypothetical protein
MRCNVAYGIGKRPSWLTHRATGVLTTDETGLRIDGPVPYRAEFSEIRWLSVTNRTDWFYIAIGSSPPVFVTPIIGTLFGIIWIIRTSLNEALYAELHQRVGGLVRCADCGGDARLSIEACPQCAAGDYRAGGSRVRHRLIVSCALVLMCLTACYVGSYCYLSRRGMREAKTYGITGFLYVPTEEAFRTREDLARHHARARFYAPLNCLDKALFGGQGPVRDIMWGLSKSNAEPAQE